MHETNYLTSGARDATHKRLLETSLHVIDVRLSLFLSLCPPGPCTLSSSQPFALSSSSPDHSRGES